jgi:hypothetical protein
MEQMWVYLGLLSEITPCPLTFACVAQLKNSSYGLAETTERDASTDPESSLNSKFALRIPYILRLSSSQPNAGHCIPTIHPQPQPLSVHLSAGQDAT